jgi:PPP family 3-phenylpropionic acid transporter
MPIRLFYICLYAGLGILFPLLSVYLQQEVKLSGTQIGLLMSIGPIAMIVAQPLWGVICDATQRSKSVLIMAMWMTGLCAVGFFLTRDYLLMLGIMSLLSFFQAALVPISDSMTMSYVQRTNGNYGRFRLWGAVGYAVAAYAMGVAAQWWGVSVIFVAFAVTMAMGAWMAGYMPDERVTLKLNLRGSLSRLLRNRRYVLFLLATFCMMGPIQANNAYFSLLFQSLGGTVAASGLGFLLAAGSEVPFMRWAQGWIKRHGILAVVLLSALVAGIRWLLYFTEPPLWLVYSSTFLQGASTGLFIPAALAYVIDMTPRDVRLTGVALYTSMGNGLGNWFFTFLGGVLIDRFNVFATYLFFGLFTMLGAVLIWILRHAERRELEGNSARG